METNNQTESKIDKIKSLYASLNSYSKVGKIMGISRQRIHQIVKDYNNFGRTYKRKEIYDSAWRDNCSICNNKTDVLHHKDFNNKNDNKDNLMPLCSNCHYKIHKSHLEEISVKKCKSCGRSFEEFKSHLIKIGLCFGCKAFSEGRTNGKKIFYPKNCIDCGVLTVKKERIKGRCRKCAVNFRYKTDAKRREYIKEYYKKRREDPLYRELHKQRCRQYNLKRKGILIK